MFRSLSWLWRIIDATLVSNPTRADQGPSSSHTSSHVAQSSWRPAEDMSFHDHCRPGTDLRTTSLRPRTMEKGLGESV